MLETQTPINKNLLPIKRDRSDGYCGSAARRENYPGQETEYMRGYRSGWSDGQGQPRTTF